ncbi:MAG TPA: hypothetical protein VJS37_13755, partial [Terriglobales bacterium]|nr:hypothetical protein [Terriglobales bacterium]
LLTDTAALIVVVLRPFDPGAVGLLRSLFSRSCFSSPCVAPTVSEEAQLHCSPACARAKDVPDLRVQPRSD